MNTKEFGKMPYIGLRCCEGCSKTFQPVSNEWLCPATPDKPATA